MRPDSLRIQEILSLHSHDNHPRGERERGGEEGESEGKERGKRVREKSEGKERGKREREREGERDLMNECMNINNVFPRVFIKNNTRNRNCNRHPDTPYGDQIEMTGSMLDTHTYTDYVGSLIIRKN